MQLTTLKPIQDLNKVFSDSVRRLMLNTLFQKLDLFLSSGERVV
jgi:hypothetical protein